MNARWKTALAALPARQLNLLVAGAIAIAAALAWTVALRAPLANFKAQRATLVTLQATAAATAAQPRLAPLAAGAAAAAAPAAAPDPLALIGAVSRSAALAGVGVSSAAQGAEQTAGGLHLQVLDIAATGSYAGIQAWLEDIEHSQPAVGILQLELRPDETGQHRHVKLQLAIYSLAGAGAAKP
ncbi:type II secretion system (T2SS) protein M subtype b [Pseudoduganella lurida]|uniref:Type II secretion system (T2SS) protein M subtype b n=1 Tax=Pseudoduganella lurida TaxID=1036180 RepID=A0A562RMW0_9BURK|nr:GspMb/PilO family protein [Pseudoduganella lurida]TWI69760.1 type II secretion system (T2SS) protein M subtype b [Pseudoduganella lurida]